MNTLEKILVYVALVLSIVAIVGVGSSSGILGVSSTSINQNCNGRAYCTAFVDLLFRNASSTYKVDLQGPTTFSSTTVFTAAAGTVTIRGGLTATGTATLYCQKVYQVGATTAASTTYYLVASTTLSADNLYPMFATSSKPAFCP